MALKRMFSLLVTDTDAFLDMSTSAQALYFHLGMHGDDDGFVGSPKKIMRAAGCNADDMKLLATKGFIIPFDSGVIVIRDWKINNDLKNDRYHETIYQDEKALIAADASKRYVLVPNTDTTCIQDVSKTETEHNITKQNVTEQNKEVADKPPRSTAFQPPTVEEVAAYCGERGNNVDPQRFVDFYTASGWKRGNTKIKDWRACVRTWEKGEYNGSGAKTNEDVSKRTAERFTGLYDVNGEPG